MSDQKVDIVFIQPPGWASQNPPLGLALLKSSLSKKGLNAKAMDLNIILYNLRHGEYKDAWEPSNGYYTWERESYVRQMFEYYSFEILDFIHSVLLLKPKAIGFSTHCSSIISARLLASKIKQFSPETKIVFGGPQVASYTRNWGSVFTSGTADAVVFGEGEESIAEYIASFDRPLGRSIKGVAYKDASGQLINGGARDLIPSLDSLPFADFSDFNLRLYAGRNVLPTYFSRGCINRCIYCTENQFFPRFRNRSGERVFDEIMHQLKIYPDTEYFRMHDSVSNGNIKELETLCDLLIDNRVNIGFSLENATVRKEMDSRLYTKLKHAGCNIIGYGLESPSKPLLKSIGKMACLEADFDKVVDEGAKAKITIGLNMMFGLPGETDEDFKGQLDFIRRHRGRRKYMLINPALNFCYFPEGCAASSDPVKYGVDMSLGELYWSEKNGRNTFPERLGKFEVFCGLAEKLGYKNLFNITRSINKNEMLGKYYYKKKEYTSALEHLNMSFRTEAKTLELVRDIARVYDESGASKEEEYQELKKFMTEIDNPAEGWLEQMNSRDALENFITSRRVPDMVNRLEAFLSERSESSRFSLARLKEHIKHELLRPIEMADRRHLILYLLAQDIDSGKAADFFSLPAAPRLQLSLSGIARYAMYFISGTAAKYERLYADITQSLKEQADR